jgi:hypothetical protein
MMLLINWSELGVKPEKVETAKKSTSSHEHRPPLTFGLAQRSQCAARVPVLDGLDALDHRESKPTPIVT